MAVVIVGGGGSTFAAPMPRHFGESWRNPPPASIPSEWAVSIRRTHGLLASALSPQEIFPRFV